MASDAPMGWCWSEEYKNYYYVTYDQWNRPQYHWAPVPENKTRRDSGGGTGDLGYRPSILMPPEPVSGRIRLTPGFISGTPMSGWYNSLDPAYRMRTMQEASRFFVEGRVFSMLLPEPAETPVFINYNPDAYVIVRYGEQGARLLRLFVVVEVKHGFVNACSIGTYLGKGELKAGCRPSEYAIVYLSGTDPAFCRIPGEFEAGMLKEPIEVEPADSSAAIPLWSRIRFSERYSIEMNVYVRDIGCVCSSQLSTLIQYYSDESKEDFDRVASGVSNVEYNGVGSSETSRPESNDDNPYLLRRDEDSHLSADRMEGIDSRLVGNLHSEYVVINNPRGFFKKGRVFMVPWPELGGDFVKDQSGPQVLIKIRRFVVIRPKATFCLCFPISTYQGQATTKPGVGVQDHAAVVLEGGEAQYHLKETKLQKSPMFIKVENPSIGSIDPMSRINFAKVYTVEYNVKVRNVGRFIPDSIWRMDEHFKDCFGLGDT